MSDVTINEAGFTRDSPHGKKLNLRWTLSGVEVTLRGRRGALKGIMLVELEDLKRAVNALHYGEKSSGGEGE